MCFFQADACVWYAVSRKKVAGTFFVNALGFKKGGRTLLGRVQRNELG